MVKLDAQYYQANSSKQAQLADEVLAYHAFSKTETLLDLDCGDGAVKKAYLALDVNSDNCYVDIVFI